MILMNRVRSFFANLQSTDSLLQQLRSSANLAALASLAVLKERMAHQDGSLENCDLSGANLANATFATSKFQQANFSGANLQNTYFFEVDAVGARFNAANLSGANLRSARMQEADFQDANLSGANFARADLSGASLQNANLHHANFWQTTLKGADLRGADLTGANVTDVRCNETTILPDGTPWSDEVNWAAFTHHDESHK